MMQIKRSEESLNNLKHCRIYMLNKSLKHAWLQLLINKKHTYTCALYNYFTLKSSIICFAVYDMKVVHLERTNPA